MKQYVIRWGSSPHNMNMLYTCEAEYEVDAVANLYANTKCGMNMEDLDITHTLKEKEMNTYVIQWGSSRINMNNYYQCEAATSTIAMWMLAKNTEFNRILDVGRMLKGKELKEYIRTHQPDEYSTRPEEYSTHTNQHLPNHVRVNYYTRMMMDNITSKHKFGLEHDDEYELFLRGLVTEINSLLEN